MGPTRLPIALQTQLAAAERGYRTLLAQLGLDESSLNRLADRIRCDPRGRGPGWQAARRGRGGRHV